MNKNHEKLKSLIEEGEILLKNLNFTTFEKYQTRVLHIVEDIFSEDSRQVDKIKYELNDNEDWMSETIESIGTLLELYLDNVPKDKITKKDVLVETQEFDKTKVFVVHGHDKELKLEVARVIEKLKLKAIILHEQANGGNTIIEKLEKNTDVGFGIVLYTPCDEGGKKGEIFKPRARQNVIFEHGLLIGKLTRERVATLVKGDIELPGDISGIVYTSTGNEWKFSLVGELKKLGYDVDANDLF